MAKLKKGAKAPQFKLLDQNGKPVKRSDFKDKKLLIYFYPKADTPGCTKQACSIRDNRRKLASLRMAVVGISPDEPGKQGKFDDKYNLVFPLLSDPDHATAEAYGAWGTKSMYGKKYEGVIRSSFLVDEKGKIMETWYKVSPLDTVPKALKAMEGS